MSYAHIIRTVQCSAILYGAETVSCCCGSGLDEKKKAYNVCARVNNSFCRRMCYIFHGVFFYFYDDRRVPRHLFLSHMIWVSRERARLIRARALTRDVHGRTPRVDVVTHL